MKRRRSYATIEKTYRALSGATPADIAVRQLAQLRTIVRFHFDRNPVYRKMVQDQGMAPERLADLRDLARLPVLDGDTLIRHGERFYSCPEQAITYLHTSGSTGQSKIIPVTAREKRALAFNDALTAYILGVRGGPIYCTYPTGPWPSAFFAQNGAEMLAGTVRADMGLPMDWHVSVLKRFRPKVIMASPSYISYFASELEKRQVDIGDLGVAVIKLAGEPLSAGVRQSIAAKFGAAVMDLYGSAEIGAASVECAHLTGSGCHHYLATSFIFEVQEIGSNGVLCQPGERGELLVTALFRQSVPIIRYNTRDIVRLPADQAPCPCGLSLPISSAILGRSDDMLTYGGANVYPEMIYKALSALGMDDKFQVRLETASESRRDVLVVRVEREDATTAAPYPLERALEANLRKASAELDYVFDRHLVPPIRLELVGRGALYRGAAKLKRFLDARDRPSPEIDPMA